jgi:hypothetical protein
VAGSHPKTITDSAQSEDDIIYESSEEGRLKTAEQIRVYRHRNCVRVSHFWRLDHHCPFKQELCRVATVLMASTNWVGLELGTGSKVPMGVESSQAAKRHNICQLLVLHVSDCMHKTHARSIRRLCIAGCKELQAGIRKILVKIIKFNGQRTQIQV